MRTALWVLIATPAFLMSAPVISSAQSAVVVGEDALGPGFLWPSDTIDRIFDDLVRASAAGEAPEGAMGTEYLAPGDEGYKSPGRAFFTSLVLPGVGELYAGSKRGLAFLGVELLSWGGYFYYDGKGEDERSNYQAFADAHYSRDRYRDVVNEINGKYENYPDPADWPGASCEYEHCADSLQANSRSKCEMHRGHFLLPEVNNQHYYEDLGKYDKYIFGWDDWYEAYTFGTPPRRDGIVWNRWAPGDTFPLPVLEPPYDTTVGLRSDKREQYREMRRKSNDYLDRATYFTWFVVINHVASALDAAFAARDHNRRLAGDPRGVEVGMDTRPLDRNDLETRVFFKKWF